ncbi:7 transmembrane receptor (rhodopsin) [Mactra antiquata]
MLAMYVAVLFLPVAVIGYCYTRILFKIWREKSSQSAWFQQRRVKRDIQVTLSVALVIVSFIVSWLPYAVVSLMEGYFHYDIARISPMLVQLPCLMAKTACIWNPIVYVCHNSRYRQAYIQTFSFIKLFSEHLSMDSEKYDSTESKDKSNALLRSAKTESVTSTV